MSFCVSSITVVALVRYCRVFFLCLLEAFQSSQDPTKVG